MVSLRGHHLGTQHTGTAVTAIPTLGTKGLTPESADFNERYSAPCAKWEHRLPLKANFVNKNNLEKDPSDADQCSGTLATI